MSTRIACRRCRSVLTDDIGSTCVACSDSPAPYSPESWVQHWEALGYCKLTPAFVLAIQTTALKDGSQHYRELDAAYAAQANEVVALRKKLRELESQGGGPAVTSTRDDFRVATAAEPAGAPPCDYDAALLAAIRARAELGYSQIEGARDVAFGDRRTLLRIVDKLNERLRCETLNGCNWARAVDDLRAKLARNQDALY